ncbi:DUF397 domain-containing protein [Sphaerisporangium dianthi]|uniref:DUF397 domain-containing protein n=2 Tax=Sphaerisporangium dianthi TaxID=1436120 RepID=A0ABV9CAE5_9ACTN
MENIDSRIGEWRKSSYSANGNCVETAIDRAGRTYLRDSKNLGPMISVSAREFAALCVFLAREADR